MNYAKTVKKRLIDFDMSSGELCRRVSEKTGKYFDDSYLSKILNGKLATPGMIKAINEILDIKEE